MKSLAVMLASGLYLSFLPGHLFRKYAYTGAGLIGTAWGVFLLPVLPLEPLKQGAVWLGMLLLIVAISDVAEDELKRTDDPRIVVDETIGYLTAMFFLPRSAGMLIAAFVLFRVFDVWKPAGIRRLSKWPGGWGVVMDDVLAGVYVNVILRLAQKVHPF